MAYIIGVGLALVVAASARWAGFDRDRALYPTLLVAIASYYVLFAVMSSSTHALIVESIVMAAFSVIAGVGFRFNLWFVVVAAGCLAWVLKRSTSSRDGSTRHPAACPP